MLPVPMFHKKCLKFGTLKVDGFKLSRNIINIHGNFGKKKTIILSHYMRSLEQEPCLQSRSEYIQLIASRLGLPSEYNYWLAEYSTIIP